MKYCLHEERVVDTYVEDNIGFDGYYQTEHEGYYCKSCGEPLEGNPALDRAEAIAEAEAEAQLMEILGK